VEPTQDGWTSNARCPQPPRPDGRSCRAPSSRLMCAGVVPDQGPSRDPIGPHGRHVSRGGPYPDLEGPPPVTIRYGDNAIELATYTYCFDTLCADGFQPEPYPDIGSPSRSSSSSHYAQGRSPPTSGRRPLEHLHTVSSNPAIATSASVCLVGRNLAVVGLVLLILLLVIPLGIGMAMAPCPTCPPATSYGLSLCVALLVSLVIASSMLTIRISPSSRAVPTLLLSVLLERPPRTV
jgi:hypothetical protein